MLVYNATQLAILPDPDVGGLEELNPGVVDWDPLWTLILPTELVDNPKEDLFGLPNGLR